MRLFGHLRLAMRRAGRAKCCVACWKAFLSKRRPLLLPSTVLIVVTALDAPRSLRRHRFRISARPTSRLGRRLVFDQPW